MKDYNQHKFSIGSFLVGVASAAIAGGYFLFLSKRAKHNRLKVDLWLEDAKEEIFSKLEKIKDVTQEKFDDVVHGVMKKYAQFKDLKEDKIDKIKQGLKEQWEEVREEMDED